MKKLFIVFWGLAALVVLLMVSSFIYESYLGRDSEKLEIKSDEYSFSAKRNKVGVWKVDVKRVEDLWFAFGYIQMFDREVQMELLRNASLGKLSAIVGEKALGRDRLMRAGARGAQVEWHSLDEKSLIRRASQSFVDGVQAFKSTVTKPEPIEFQMLGLKRTTNEAWSAWELLAIARYQAWQFSFDLEHEVVFEKLKRILNDDQMKISDYFPRVGVTASKYDTQGLKASVKSWKNPNGKLKDFWTPQEELGPIESRIPVETADRSVKFEGGGKFAYGGREEHWASLGASNAWVISHPVKTKDDDKIIYPTLCNDTHLRMAWPSPLYPIEYNLDGDKVSGRGFTLPGVPGLVLGSIENDRGRRLAWAITLGNYADTQDLIVDKTHQSRVVAKIKERYLIKNPKTSVLDERVIEEKWTQFGLDVSELFSDEMGIKEDPAQEVKTGVYLDWAGYRQLKNPIEFYIRRNLFLDENMVDDLQQNWDYPAVNLSWMAGQTAGATEVGHILTGLQYARNRKGNTLVLNSDQYGSRRVIRLGAEKYFHKKLDHQEFFMVSANQKPYTNQSTEDAAYSWESETRGNRIWDSRSAILERVDSEQTDYFSTVLVEFFQRARSKVSANQLCQIGTLAERDFCFKLWNKIEKWGGLLSSDSWEATVIALWMSLSKQLIFPENYPWANDQADEFFQDYSQKGFSDLALLEIMRSDQRVKDWEKAHKAIFVKRLGELFSKTLSILVEKRGPDARLWNWGIAHAMDWYYPLGEAPKPWGDIIEESFLGPRPPVGGGFDSPGSFEFQWSPRDPAEFPARHAAAMRACYEFTPGEKTKVSWAVPNGPSGNPFSKWAQTFPKKSFFKGVLLPAD